MKKFSTEAIVLKRFNYGEADRILTLFTKDYGKMTVIAKGVRKPKSRKRGHVELFNHIKAQVVNGRGMGILTEAETVGTRHGVFMDSGTGRTRHGVFLRQESKEELQRLFYAYQFSELIDKFMPDEESNPEIFDLLEKSLKLLHLKTEISQLRAIDGYFKNRLIRILGFWPSDRSVPMDIDEYLNSILERPLNSVEVWRRMV